MHWKTDRRIRTRAKRAILLGSAAALAVLGGCASSDAGGSASVGGAPPGSSGLSQPGAQDFGLFREILDQGQIPDPTTIDSLGFFAEHKLEYPAAECGESVCMHGLLGVTNNMINGAQCTLIQIGLNTPLTAESLQRRPLDLVLAVDVSGSMAGDPINYLRTGLERMLNHLEPTDTVSIVTFASQTTHVVDSAPADATFTLESAIAQLQAAGQTDLYGGLFEAYVRAEALLDPARETRVVLLSDGEATAGLLNNDKLASLAASYASLGIPTTTIGVGNGFDVDAMRRVAEVGAGSFYFLEDPVALLEVFTEEVQSFLTPVALDVHIETGIGEGWRIGQVYGTNGWTPYGTGGAIDIPAMFLAGRTTVSDPTSPGRRGGGSGILLELVPLSTLGAAAAPTQVGTLELTYRAPADGTWKTQSVVLNYPYATTEIPDGGYFTHPTVEKGFVMLNLLAGFQLASALALDSDVGSAIGVLSTLEATVGDWLDEVPDEDIADDLTIVRQFIGVLESLPDQTKVQPPPNPWPID